MGGLHRLPYRLAHLLGVDLEAVAEGAPQQIADPAVELLGERAGELAMVHQRRAQRDDALGSREQAQERLLGKVGLAVPGQGGEHRRLAAASGRLHDLRAKAGAARHLDLMLDQRLGPGGLQQVVVLQQRALADDRAGDLDLVPRQEVDQRLPTTSPADASPSARALRISRSARPARATKTSPRRSLTSGWRTSLEIGAEIDRGEEQPIAVTFGATLGHSIKACADSTLIFAPPHGSCQFNTDTEAQ